MPSKPAPFLDAARSLAAPVLDFGAWPLPVADTVTAALRWRLWLPMSRPVVRVDRFVSYRIPRFGPRGAGPHQRGAEIYLETGSRDQVRRYLAEHLETFKPGSLAELLFGSSDLSLHPLTEMHPLEDFHPWTGQRRQRIGYLAQGTATFGPISEKRLDAETDRLIGVTTSIAETGYRPERYWKGYLRGYFLLRDGDYRFYLKGGRHRAGAMAALGIADARVRCSSHTPTCIDVSEVDRWPHVRSGYVSRDLALRMFNRYFE